MTALIASVFLTAATISTNSWLAEWDTPYGMPPFNELKVSEYVDAIKAGSELKQKRIKAIVENKEKPTFKNTIIPYVLQAKNLAKPAEFSAFFFR